MRKCWEKGIVFRYIQAVSLFFLGGGGGGGGEGKIISKIFKLSFGILLWYITNFPLMATKSLYRSSVQRIKLSNLGEERVNIFFPSLLEWPECSTFVVKGGPCWGCPGAIKARSRSELYNQERQHSVAHCFTCRTKTSCRSLVKIRGFCELQSPGIYGKIYLIGMLYT